MSPERAKEILRAVGPFGALPEMTAAEKEHIEAAFSRVPGYCSRYDVLCEIANGRDPLNQKMVICPECDGQAFAKWKNGTGWKVCLTCENAGFVSVEKSAKR